MTDYYPEQRFIKEMMTIERHVQLPEVGLGQLQVAQGQRVDVRETVGRVMMPSPYTIIPAAKLLGLRKPEELPGLMLVKLRARVGERDAIAGKDAKRGKRVFAPHSGIVVYVGEGKIVLQTVPEIKPIEAGLRGLVTRVELPKRFTIEGSGGLVQGVWGNGRNIIAIMREEPPETIEKMELNALDTTYRNEIIITKRPLNTDMLRVALVRRFAGFIAPSAPAYLLPYLQTAEQAILLTEGFGNQSMSSIVSSLLQEYDGHQVTLDAVTPSTATPRRPEIVINRASSTPAPAPNYEQTLRPGMEVRITSAPYNGEYARVVEVLDEVAPFANGLRLPAARVELFEGDVVEIPLSNLELAGR